MISPYPRIGAFNRWEKDGKRILGPDAYFNEVYWLNHLEGFFPEKIKRIKGILKREPSLLKTSTHRTMDYAVYKLLEFLNKNYRVADKER